MNEFQDYIINLLPPHKMKKSGEYVFNCPTCYRTESRSDTKKRGHLSIDGDGFVYHCFNCHFATGWTIGQGISKNMKTFLSDLGCDFRQIREVRNIINKLNNTDGYTPQVKVEKRIFRDIPSDYKSILQSYKDGESSNTFTRIYDYLMTRNPRLLYYTNLMWKEGDEAFLIPCYENNKIVGYSLRSIHDSSKNKYIHFIPSGYIFNYDTLFDDKKYIILAEGALDALCVDGISFLTNSFPDDKLKRLYQVMGNKEIIVVPDQDNGGKLFVNELLKKNIKFSVSFPSWGCGIKDIEEATRKYGRLWVVDDILKHKESDKLKIQIKNKKGE